MIERAIALLEEFHSIPIRHRPRRLEDFQARTEERAVRIALELAAEKPTSTFLESGRRLSDEHKHHLLLAYLSHQYETGHHVRVVPIDSTLGSTELSYLNEVVVRGFNGKIAAIEVTPPVQIGGKHYDYPTFYRFMFDSFRGGITLAYTDKEIKVGPQTAGGFGMDVVSFGAVSLANFPMVTEDDQAKKLDRVAALAIHELGHIFGLEHHDREIQPGVMCPMINRIPKNFADVFRDGYRVGYRELLDSRADRLCDICYEDMAVNQ